MPTIRVHLKAAEKTKLTVVFTTPSTRGIQRPLQSDMWTARAASTVTGADVILGVTGKITWTNKSGVVAALTMSRMMGLKTLLVTERERQDPLRVRDSTATATLMTVTLLVVAGAAREPETTKTQVRPGLVAEARARAVAVATSKDRRGKTPSTKRRAIPRTSRQVRRAQAVLPGVAAMPVTLMNKPVVAPRSSLSGSFGAPGGQQMGVTGLARSDLEPPRPQRLSSRGS